MESMDLLLVCISSFIGVFVLLSVLALVMKIIIAIFPEKAATVDAAVVAALAATIGTVYPGTKITNIEEMK